LEKEKEKLIDFILVVHRAPYNLATAMTFPR
jgi:hypothetical protein